MTMKDLLHIAYSNTMQVVYAVVTLIHNIHNTSGNDVINGLRRKNANITSFGGGRKLKPFFFFK